MPTKSPMQPAGWVVLAVGVASLVGTFLVGWRELLVLAIGCAAILVSSVGFVIGRTDIRLVRRLVPERVTVGEPAVAELHAENRGSTRSARQTIHESMNGVPVAVPLPALKSGEETMSVWHPPTNRRGVHRLGPARITKADPCRLMQRDVGQTKVDELWVQPKVVPLPAVSAGLTKDMEGPTFDYSPAGDVAFHAIRPYRIGDDARHVHWMATARAGEMMVRHYVDNRQPYVSVLLDTNAASWSSLDEFDAAVDIAASLGFASLGRGQPVSVHAGPKTLLGHRVRSDRAKLLDDLTLVEMDTSFELPSAMGAIVSIERNTTIAIVLTGSARTGGWLQTATAKVAQSCSVMLVRVGAEADDDEARLAVGRGVQSLTVMNVDDFARSIGREVSVA